MWRKRNRKRAARAPVKLPDVNWRRTAAGVAVAVLAGGAYAGVTWLLNRPIETMVINGAFQRVSAIQLEALVETRARSGFLDVDLAAIRRDLAALPWIASAEIRRRWPGTLEIRVTEQTPMACWGERGLLNASGKLFLVNADHVPAELPRLRGPDGTEAQVTSRYFAVQAELEHRGMAAVSMTLNERGAWTFDMSNGIQVRLGANSVDQRIERFFKVLDGAMAHMAGEVEYVDMRYPNGFAIGWKNREAVQAAASGEPRPHA